MALCVLLVALACGMILFARTSGAAPALDGENASAAAPKWCKACIDLECYVYISYPCLREAE